MPPKLIQVERVATKACCVCGEDKPLDQFYRKSDALDGRQRRCKPCSHKATSEWNKANPEKQRRHLRRRDLKKKYGLTEERYELMLDEQGGGCAICGARSSGGTGNSPFPVDHNHVTGEVRGILCTGCNIKLAALDDPEWLAAALEYLNVAEIDTGGTGGYSS